MQGTPFNLPFEQDPHVLSMDTDTATPRPQISIYYIHSLESPFCRNATCACHRKSREVARLIGFVAEGIMTLREAANLIDEERIEGEA